MFEFWRVNRIVGLGSVRFVQGRKHVVRPYMKSAEAERGSREVQIFPVLMWAVARQKEEKTNEGFKGGRSRLM